MSKIQHSPAKKEPLATPEEQISVYPEHPREFLKSAGWVEASKHSVPNPAKRWRDPKTSYPDLWYYAMAEAVELQLRRDGKLRDVWSDIAEARRTNAA